jgi:hypothetical protein
MKKAIASRTFPSFWALTFCLVSFAANAQTKQKWFRQEYGVAQSAVYDDGQSLVKYKGTGTQLHIGNDRETTKSIVQFDNVFVWTPLSAQIDNAKYGTDAQQGNYRISYSYLRKLPKTQDNAVKFAVGGSVSGDFNMRFYTALANNVISWDINLGLNAVGRAQYDFQWGKHSFSTTYQLGLPILTYNHRPNYLGYFPIGAGFEGKAGTSAPWSELGRTVLGVNGNYFYLTQQINLDKILQNGNRVRLGYNWQYSNNGFATHRYQNILSGLSIGILTNISKMNKTN